MYYEKKLPTKYSCNNYPLSDLGKTELLNIAEIRTNQNYFMFNVIFYKQR